MASKQNSLVQVKVQWSRGKSGTCNQFSKSHSIRNKNIILTTQICRWFKWDNIEKTMQQGIPDCFVETFPYSSTVCPEMTNYCYSRWIIVLKLANRETSSVLGVHDEECCFSWFGYFSEIGLRSILKEDI